MPDLTFRLQTLLKREKEKPGIGSYYRLARIINEANTAAEHHFAVTHKFLEGVAEDPENTYLGLRHLRALDIYFAKQGEGLRDKPIFVRPGVLEPLLQPRKVTFLLGSKPQVAAQLIDISPWDSRSLAEVLSRASQVNEHIDWEIEESVKLPITKKVEAVNWFQRLGAGDRSLVAVGSPLACLASELMLAEMFDVPPFAGPLHGKPLPFYFAWRPELVENFRSSFAMTHEDLKPLDKKVARAVEKNKGSAFILNGKPLFVPKKGRKWRMYGTIVAQRRPKGNVWMVLSGLTGPATYAAALLIKRIEAELPWPVGKQLPLLWAPFYADVVADTSEKYLGDFRKVKGKDLLGDPEIWPPVPRDVQAPAP